MRACAWVCCRAGRGVWGGYNKSSGFKGRLNCVRRQWDRKGHMHTRTHTHTHTHTRTHTHTAYCGRHSLTSRSETIKFTYSAHTRWHTRPFPRLKLSLGWRQPSTGLLVIVASPCDWSAAHRPLGTRVVVRMRWLLRDWVITRNALCSQHLPCTPVTVT